MHQHAFGDLKFEEVWIHAGLIEDAAHLLSQIRLAKLSGRKIDGHVQRLIRRKLILPKFELEAGLSQHPLTDVQDKPTFFGDGNEIHWRDQAPLRMLPANQSLKTA